MTKEGLMLQQVQQVQQKAMDLLINGEADFSKQVVYISPHKLEKGSAFDSHGFSHEIEKQEGKQVWLASTVKSR